MSPEPHDAELAVLAAALANLKPLAAHIDRDQVLFRAGQMSVSRRRWLWPSVAATLALLSGGLGGWQVFKAEPQQVTQIVYVRPEAPTSPASDEASPYIAMPSAAADNQLAPLSTFGMEQLALRWGIDALPDRPPASGTWQPDPFLDLRDARKLLQIQTR